MPVYHYKCSSCGDEYETYHSIKEDIRTTCKICQTETLTVVLDGAPVIINKEIKTIGQLAEANAKKMGRSKLEEKMAQDGVKQKLESQEKMKQARKIASLSPEQKTKYIETGKL
jgi:putative FmdB family regulatory protein